MPFRRRLNWSLGSHPPDSGQPKVSYLVLTKHGHGGPRLIRVAIADATLPIN